MLASPFSQLDGGWCSFQGFVFYFCVFAGALWFVLALNFNFTFASFRWLLQAVDLFLRIVLGKRFGTQLERRIFLGSHALAWGVPAFFSFIIFCSGEEKRLLSFVLIVSSCCPSKAALSVCRM